MKIPKERVKVNIFCNDGTFVRGFVHISEGLRLLDFINHESATFVVVTEAEFQNLKEVHSFSLLMALSKRKSTIILNKSSIKWIEEAR
ncbi:MAG: hypothetical protein Q8O30_11435 [Candidatus Omnitrophota bacterium]|nr:hypothetical protein [Candidatus Omnitrophota bacterium]